MILFGNQSQAEYGIRSLAKQDSIMEMKMSKVIRASIVFEYLVDEDEVMSELTLEDQIEYVKETTVEDIMSMGFGNSDDLLQAINIEIINV
jgi:ABC-type lipopolysaccharide export system ATPase subunit